MSHPRPVRQHPARRHLGLVAHLGDEPRGPLARQTSPGVSAPVSPWMQYDASRPDAVPAAKTNWPVGSSPRHWGPLRSPRAPGRSTARWRHRPPRQAVVATIAHIQEPPRRREVNLGAGVPGGEPLW